LFVETAILFLAVWLAVFAYFTHKLMSVLSDLQAAAADLQNVSALVVQEFSKPRILESDVAAVTPLIVNATDSLRRALPVPPPS
jgi:hypothetical protein